MCIRDSHKVLARLVGLRAEGVPWGRGQTVPLSENPDDFGVVFRDDGAAPLDRQLAFELVSGEDHVPARRGGAQRVELPVEDDPRRRWERAHNPSGLEAGDVPPDVYKRQGSG